MKWQDIRIAATIKRGNKEAVFNTVLLDTGSAGCVFSADVLREAGIEPPPEALIRRNEIISIFTNYQPRHGRLQTVVGTVQLPNYLITNY